MIRLGKKKIASLLSLCSICFLTSCQKYYLSLTDRKIDVNYLASTHVATPDKRQKNPPYGDMIVMDWRLPKEIVAKNPVIKLHVLYGNYTEKTFDYPVRSRMGFATYKDLDQEYTDTKGIITYSAEVVLDDGSIYKSWKHQLWVNLITLIEEPKESPSDTAQVEGDLTSDEEIAADDDELYDDEDDLLTYDEMQEVSMEPADSSSFSVKQKLMQGSVIDTDAFIDETSSDSD